MAAAQRFPEIFDGIITGAPAINWATYVVAEQWPQVVMRGEDTFPAPCELKAFMDASIAEYDRLDGVRDGVITNPDACHFDPYRLVGSKIPCDGAETTITQSAADVVQRTLDGPATLSGSSLWHGLSVGAPLDSLANTTTATGMRIGAPFFVNDAWIRYFLARDPGFNVSGISYAKFTELFRLSKEVYDDIIGTDDPDLSRFRDAGGKIIMWHGLSDQLIPPKGSRDYRRRVERLMGGSTKVDEFYRLFLALGVGHWRGGTTAGVALSDPLKALVAWVGEHEAPDTLTAETTDTTGAKVTRKLCRYPLISQYLGTGDPRSANHYRCI